MYIEYEFMLVLSMLQKSCILVSKLAGKGINTVEYINIDRTGVNTYLIRIKLCKTQNSA